MCPKTLTELHLSSILFTDFLMRVYQLGRSNLTTKSPKVGEGRLKMHSEVLVYLFVFQVGLYIPKRDMPGIERIAQQLLVFGHCSNDGYTNGVSDDEVSFDLDFSEIDGHDVPLNRAMDRFLNGLSIRTVKPRDLEVAVFLFPSLELIGESGINHKRMEEFIPEIRMAACIPMPGGEGKFCSPLYSGVVLRNRKAIAGKQSSLGNCYNCSDRQCLSLSSEIRV